MSKILTSRRKGFLVLSTASCWFPAFLKKLMIKLSGNYDCDFWSLNIASIVILSVSLSKSAVLVCSWVIFVLYLAFSDLMTPCFISCLREFVFIGTKMRTMTTRTWIGHLSSQYYFMSATQKLSINLFQPACEDVRIGPFTFLSRSVQSSSFRGR